MKSFLNSIKLRKNKKQVSNDTGRSMVEMLGVLAVIGVLSIGGIIGYKFAMAKYQANHVVAEINYLRNDMEQQMLRGNQTVSLGDPYGEAGQNDGYLKTNGYPTKYNCGEGIEGEFPLCKYEETYYIAIDDVSLDICRQIVPLIKNMRNLAKIDVNGVENGTASNCLQENEAGEDNHLLLLFKVEQRGATPPDDYCKSNGGCFNGNQCYDNTCGCKEGDCVDPFECDEETKKCTECKTHTDCRNEYGMEKPMCLHGACTSCGYMYFWDAAKSICVAGGCTTNYDCKSGEFCLTSDAKNNPEFEDNYSNAGECQVAEKYALAAQGDKYRLSKEPMNKYSAERFCEALGGGMRIMKLGDFDCAIPISDKQGNCFKNNPPVLPNGEYNKNWDPDNISSVVTDIASTYNITTNTSYWISGQFSYQTYTMQIPHGGSKTVENKTNLNVLCTSN